MEDAAKSEKEESVPSVKEEAVEEGPEHTTSRGDLAEGDPVASTGGVARDATPAASERSHRSKRSDGAGSKASVHSGRTARSDRGGVRSASQGAASRQGDVPPPAARAERATRARLDECAESIGGAGAGAAFVSQAAEGSAWGSREQNPDLWRSMSGADGRQLEPDKLELHTQHLRGLPMIFNGGGQQMRPGDWGCPYAIRKRPGIPLIVRGQLMHAHRAKCIRCEAPNRLFPNHPLITKKQGIQFGGEDTQLATTLAQLGQRFKDQAGERARKRYPGWSDNRSDCGGSDSGYASDSRSGYEPWCGHSYAASRKKGYGSDTSHRGGHYYGPQPGPKSTWQPFWKPALDSGEFGEYFRWVRL